MAPGSSRRPTPTNDDVTRNALARITGELAAAPFRTITLPIDPDSDVLSQIETAGAEQSATAAFAIVRDRNDPLSYVYDINDWLGRSQFAVDVGFTGSFLEFRIYSVALTAAQIQARYDAGPDVVL